MIQQKIQFRYNSHFLVALQVGVIYYIYPAPVSRAPNAPQSMALSTSASTLGWLHSYSLWRLAWLFDIRLPRCWSFSCSIMLLSSVIRRNASTLSASVV